MHCLVFYLRKHQPDAKKLFVLGTQGLMDDLKDAGYTIVNDHDSASDYIQPKNPIEPDAVIVGFDTDLVYPRLCQASWWVKCGKPFIATHPDVFCPTDQPTWLVDCGAVTKCVEAATNIPPIEVLGKPHAYMIKPIMEKHGLSSHELIMVGDRLGTDVQMGIKADTLSCLVLTGDSKEEDIKTMGITPTVVAPSLKELGEAIIYSKGKEQIHA